jgi:hypothetical protein
MAASLGAGAMQCSEDVVGELVTQSENSSWDVVSCSENQSKGNVRR